MLGLFDRYVQTVSERTVGSRPVAGKSIRQSSDDSFILDWSLDGTDAGDAADNDTAIELATSAK